MYCAILRGIDRLTLAKPSASPFSLVATELAPEANLISLMARLSPDGRTIGLPVEGVIVRERVLGGVPVKGLSDSSAHDLDGLTKPRIVTSAGAPGFMAFFALFFFFCAEAFSVFAMSLSLVAVYRAMLWLIEDDCV